MHFVLGFWADVDFTFQSLSTARPQGALPEICQGYIWSATFRKLWISALSIFGLAFWQTQEWARRGTWAFGFAATKVTISCMSIKAYASIEPEYTARVICQ